jgi:hypothetical protein
MKKGDYFKQVGGHDGVFWNGKEWIRFDCEACVRKIGLAINRIQGPFTPLAWKVLNHGPVEHRHQKGLHN